MIIFVISAMFCGVLVGCSVFGLISDNEVKFEPSINGQMPNRLSWALELPNPMIPFYWNSSMGSVQSPHVNQTNISIFQTIMSQITMTDYFRLLSFECMLLHTKEISITNNNAVLCVLKKCPCLVGYNNYLLILMLLLSPLIHIYTYYC